MYRAKSTSKLVDLYKVTNNNLFFNRYYDMVVKDCPIHKFSRNIFTNIFSSYNLLLNNVELFSKLGLDELFKNYQKNINLATNYFNRLIVMYILLIGINLMENITDEKFSLMHEKISTKLHDMNGQDALDELKFYGYLEYTLIKISAFTEQLCTCSVPYNCFPDEYCYRFDLIERIIYETKINDFFYFANIMDKINKFKDTNKVIIPSINLNTLNEHMIIKILNYFQHNKYNLHAYIYNSNFISNRDISYIEEEPLDIYKVARPNYCFICGEYDFDINYEIKLNSYVKTKSKKNVSDFLCVECKIKIIDKLHIPYDTTIEKLGSTCDVNIPNLLPDNRAICYFTQRRLKPLILIMANLFDVDSLFANMPVDIIYYIILSIYWNSFNAVADESFYVCGNVDILYSQFRGILGVNCK